MKISVNAQSSIRIESNEVIYFDPFQIEGEPHDADYIFITHDHYDHFSIEDITKVENENTLYIIPTCMYNSLGGPNVVVLSPNEKTMIEDYEVYTIPSYNVNKAFHPKEKGYVGYIVKIEGKYVYVAGDCDLNEDNKKVKCDIAFVPIGGHYTMDYQKAAELINIIQPKIAIPTHYGSIVGKMSDGEDFKKLVDKKIEVQLYLH